MATQEGAVGRPKLKRSLGLWMATALVIGNMVGSGVFGLPSSLASTGPISLLSWVFTGAGAILLALVFANLGRAYPQTGGPYAYARRAFGDFAGFWTAWGYWIAAWAGNAAIATIFVSYASVFWPSLGTNNALAFALGLSVIWLLTLVNIAGVRESGVDPADHDRAQVRAAAADRPHRPVLHAQRQLHALRPQPRLPGRALACDLVRRHADAVGVPRPRIGDHPGRGDQGPERTLPRATIFGTVVTTAMYVLATVAIMGVIPAATLAHSNAPVRRCRPEHLRRLRAGHVARQARSRRWR